MRYRIAAVSVLQLCLQVTDSKLSPTRAKKGQCPPPALPYPRLPEPQAPSFSQLIAQGLAAAPTPFPSSAGAALFRNALFGYALFGYALFGGALWGSLMIGATPSPVCFLFRFTFPLGDHLTDLLATI